MADEIVVAPSVLSAVSWNASPLSPIPEGAQSGETTGVVDIGIVDDLPLITEEASSLTEFYSKNNNSKR